MFEICRFTFLLIILFLLFAQPGFLETSKPVYIGWIRPSSATKTAKTVNLA